MKPWFWLFSLFIAGCSSAKDPFPETSATNASDYWFDRAEITRYELTQFRYGEILTGDSLLIFVSEPFLTDKQVKHEFGPDENAVPVLKLNRIRSFTTGIYDYRLMASIFHPIENISAIPAGLKIAMSATEWCGVAFLQINRRDGELETELRSYFQSESDQDLNLPDTWTEDELWLRLRIDPTSLPTGEFEAVPEVFYQRLSHIPLAAYSASAELYAGKDTGTSIYEITYPEMSRTLAITFERDYPHRIHGWTEMVEGKLFSKGEATHSERLYYWELKQSEDIHYREKLGLPAN